jgi:hypothetical protein
VAFDEWRDHRKGEQPMSGKSIVIAVALAGWFIASLIAFVIVALFDFMGVGLIGVLIAFVATQFELESGGIAGGAYGASMIHHQLEADRQMSPEQRAAKRTEQSISVQSTRFFRHFGIALALIGFGGFAYTYL